MGIGIDVVLLSRVRAVVERRGAARFARRILHHKEMGDFEELVRDDRRVVAFLATRFAAKEALYKAAFPAATLTWKDVYVAKQGRKPSLMLDTTMEQGRRLAEVCPRLHLSVSHDGDLATAFVVLESR